MSTWNLSVSHRPSPSLLRIEICEPIKTVTSQTWPEPTHPAQIRDLFLIYNNYYWLNYKCCEIVVI